MYENLFAPCPFITTEKFDLDTSHPLSNYVDDYVLMQFLNINRRTLQHWRSKKLLAFSKIAGKIYYNMKDVLKMFEDTKSFSCISRKDE